MSNAKRTTIEISRSGGGDGLLHPVRHTEKLQTKTGASFQDATKSMEQELERRRFEWEQEVDKMQQEFFKVNTKTSAENGDGERAVPVETSPIRLMSSSRQPGAEIIDIANSQTLYTQRPDGTKLYRLRFDVRGFDPSEISVRAEGRKLRVEAKHEETIGAGRRTTKQFNRQMDIPDHVNPDRLQSELSTDGILSVEAVVESIPDGEAVEPYNKSYTLRSSPRQSTATHDIKDLPPTPLRTTTTTRSFNLPPSPTSNLMDEMLSSSSDPSQMNALLAASHNAAPQNATERSARLSIGRYSDPLVVIVDGQRKMKLAVTVGEGYEVDDVTVSHRVGKISIKALHEQTIPWQSKRQFSREFDLPEAIEPWTLRATLYTRTALTKDLHLVVVDIDQRYVVFIY